jgi:ABC-type branched-subunit amino acid transport system ATPase component
VSGWLEVKDVEKHFDGVKALDGCLLSVGQGEIVGLIGPNGAEKTTLFNVITGFIRADSGKAELRGKDLLRMPPHRVARIGISRTFQNLRLIRRLSVLDNVLLAFKDQPGEHLGSLFFRPRACEKFETGNWEKAIALLEDAGLSEKIHDLVDNLSYGQQKLLSLMCCLAADADLLMLDEPVAGIAPEMIERILGIIRSLPDKGKSVILIEHNMDAIASVCDRVVFMDAGVKVCEGTQDEVRNDPRVIEAYIH